MKGEIYIYIYIQDIGPVLYILCVHACLLYTFALELNFFAPTYLYKYKLPLQKNKS